MHYQYGGGENFKQKKNEIFVYGAIFVLSYYLQLKKIRKRNITHLLALLYFIYICE